MTVACGGGGDSSTAPTGTGGSGSGGTFTVRVTDSPYGSARAVLITFGSVEAQDAGGNWKKLPFAGGSATRTCDLKKLQNSAQDVLGTGAMSPGSYSHVRLTIQSAKIYFDNSSSSPTPCAASIPEPAGASFPFTLAPASGDVNGVFTVTSDTSVTVLLDFDGESSIHSNNPNSYTMSPVLRVVSVS